MREAVKLHIYIYIYIYAYKISKLNNSYNILIMKFILVSNSVGLSCVPTSDALLSPVRVYVVYLPQMCYCPQLGCCVLKWPKVWYSSKSELGHSLRSQDFLPLSTFHQRSQSETQMPGINQGILRKYIYKNT